MKLMFDKKDVDASMHPLVRLLRLIFYKRNITIDKFYTLFSEHGKRLGRSVGENNIQRNNMLKVLNKNHDSMTWWFFCYILFSVLCINIEEVKISFRTESGETIVVGSNDEADEPKSESDESE